MKLIMSLFISNKEYEWSLVPDLKFDFDEIQVLWKGGKEALDLIENKKKSCTTFLTDLGKSELNKFYDSHKSVINEGDVYKFIHASVSVIDNVKSGNLIYSLNSVMKTITLSE